MPLWATWPWKGRQIRAWLMSTGGWAFQRWVEGKAAESLTGADWSLNKWSCHCDIVISSQPAVRSGCDWVGFRHCRIAYLRANTRLSFSLSIWSHSCFQIQLNSWHFFSAWGFLLWLLFLCEISRFHSFTASCKMMQRELELGLHRFQNKMF